MSRRISVAVSKPEKPIPGGDAQAFTALQVKACLRGYVAPRWSASRVHLMPRQVSRCGDLIVQRFGKYHGFDSVAAAVAWLNDSKGPEPC